MRPDPEGARRRLVADFSIGARAWRIPPSAIQAIAVALRRLAAGGAVPAWFWERETDLIVENVRRYLGGMRLLNVVDQEAGY